MQDILLEIRLRYAKFTKAEKRVADYVLGAPAEAMYQPITVMASLCDVGETSVLRFCRDIGCKGYQDMKLQVAQAVAAQTETGAMAQATGNIALNDSLETLSEKAYTASVQALEETKLHMDAAAIRKASEWLCAAAHIHFYGVGSSMLTAMEAMVAFQHSFPNVHMVSDLHQQLMTAALLTPADVAVFFSYSGASKDTLDIARRARENGAKCIAVTRSAESPLGKLCDISLLSGGRESPLQGGSITGKIAQLFLVDVLYTECFRSVHEVAGKRRAQTSGAVSDRLL